MRLTVGVDIEVDTSSLNERFESDHIRLVRKVSERLAVDLGRRRRLDEGEVRLDQIPEGPVRLVEVMAGPEDRQRGVSRTLSRDVGRART